MTVKPKIKGYLLSKAIGIGETRKERIFYWLGIDEHGFSIFVLDPLKAHLFPAEIHARNMKSDLDMPRMKVCSMTNTGKIKIISEYEIKIDENESTSW